MITPIKYGRKRNGIVKELSQQVNAWIETIDDEELRKQVAANTIVTGGSIASMLLGEKVNDFDVYFRDYETTLKVAEYYCAKFNAINNQQTLLAHVEEQSVSNIKGDVENRVVNFISSSGVTKETPKSNKEIKKLGRNRPVFISANAITLSHKFQLVTRFYGEPDQIHDNFDFIHASCYWDHGLHKLVLPAEALESMLSRTLHYSGSLYPVASIFRMKKFLDRGWRISAGQQLKIMWQISEINLADREIMTEQLTGVDQAYLQHLINVLEKAPEGTAIDSTYVCAVIDEIFDFTAEQDDES